MDRDWGVAGFGDSIPNSAVVTLLPAAASALVVALPAAIQVVHSARVQRGFAVAEEDVFLLDRAQLLDAGFRPAAEAFPAGKIWTLTGSCSLVELDQSQIGAAFWGELGAEEFLERIAQGQSQEKIRKGVAEGVSGDEFRGRERTLLGAQPTAKEAPDGAWRRRCSWCCCWSRSPT
jgi:hypothetical protein